MTVPLTKISITELVINPVASSAGLSRHSAFFPYLHRLLISCFLLLLCDLRVPLLSLRGSQGIHLSLSLANFLGSLVFLMASSGGFPQALEAAGLRPKQND